ncbi:agamous-like MADS-box protein AGL80 [Tripterygium wilfordii]|uniref:Agamous-like MADS-box protein AGL80 n=1 Tax=Tripterygium wilfordii TaxID=458696 RepID=A0A7J7CM57_TRIWF|nr:agamous-like MADS-box protein AGL80 [Tripterygium wilfordii]KAF5735026.1 agamous-like MADS-box protein AGL80 [Tripterygium wilfordii]
MARVPRKKVQLAYITDERARKATFKRRKQSLMKKASELSTLCGIDACAIIYNPYEEQHEVWPSNEEIQPILSRFHNLSEMEKGKNKVDDVRFVQLRIDKAKNQLQKLCKVVREQEIINVMFESLVWPGTVQNLNLVDLNDLGLIIQQRLKQINHVLGSLDN